MYYKGSLHETFIRFSRGSLLQKMLRTTPIEAEEERDANNNFRITLVDEIPFHVLFWGEGGSFIEMNQGIGKHGFHSFSKGCSLKKIFIFC